MEVVRRVRLMSDPTPEPLLSAFGEQRPTIIQRIFSRENLMALGLCLLIILLIIVTTDSAPQWIYQGF